MTLTGKPAHARSAITCPAKCASGTITIANQCSSWQCAWKADRLLLHRARKSMLHNNKIYSHFNSPFIQMFDVSCYCFTLSETTTSQQDHHSTSFFLYLFHFVLTEKNNIVSPVNMNVISHDDATGFSHKHHKCTLNCDYQWTHRNTNKT